MQPSTDGIRQSTSPPARFEASKIWREALELIDIASVRRSAA